MHDYAGSLVLRVNEVYHDVEGRHYEGVHPEIFSGEKERWEAFGRSLRSEREALRLLDIGSGTGFVPLTIGRFLKAPDHVICSDISARMLDICRENIEREMFSCGFSYIKLDGRNLPVDTGIDYVLMNSVLHHIPDIAAFLTEADRVLNRGGRIVIAHEPNRDFYSHPFLWNNYRLLSTLAAPGSFVASALRKMGLMDAARHLYSKVSVRGRKQLEVIREVNAVLLEEGVIDKPLTSAQMTEIVDIHSPLAGGYHKGRGIDIHEILNRHLAGYELIRFETYNHLSKLSSQRRFLKGYEKFLERRYPNQGSTTFAVIRKPH